MRHLIHLVSHELLHLLMVLACVSAVIFILMLFGCSSKASNELEQITEDVLDAERGISIIFEPLKEKK